MNSSYPTYEEYVEIFKGLPRPFAFIDLDRLNYNAQQVLDYSGTARVRLGSKSIRATYILRHLLQQNERFKGLLCFTAPEAGWLAQQGFEDLLVAYPTWEPLHVNQVLDQLRESATITLMVDSLEQIHHLGHLAQQHGTILPLCLDLDMATIHYGLHFGSWRSTIREAEPLVALAQAIEKAPNLVLDGVMGYEGQIAGVNDSAPGDRLAFIKRHLKKRSMQEVRQRRADLVGALTNAGHKLRFVNAGGSGSLTSSSQEAVVDEVTAGSAFYCPTLFSHYADYDYIPAAGFSIEVVRQAAPNIYTCLGGGYVASGAVGKDRLPEPFLPDGAALVDLEGAGEVQTPIKYSGHQPLSMGSSIFMRHAKAGELCERFNELHIVANGEIIDTVPTYRGEMQCFL
ncbi:MAG: alanine racemase [Chloroflexota bacterium]